MHSLESVLEFAGASPIKTSSIPIPSKPLHTVPAPNKKRNITDVCPAKKVKLWLAVSQLPLPPLLEQLLEVEPDQPAELPKYFTEASLYQFEAVQLLELEAPNTCQLLPPLRLYWSCKPSKLRSVSQNILKVICGYCKPAKLKHGLCSQALSPLL